MSASACPGEVLGQNRRRMDGQRPVAHATRGSVATLALLVSTLGLLGALHAQAPSEGWRTFEGTWSAVGRRQTVPTETGRAAVVTALSGTVTITSAAGLAAGFRAEVIGFDDGAGGGAGRAVWTDSRGDQVFSALKGEPVETGRHVLGTLTGGTGRYAGITGEYALTWQYVVRGEEEVVQGRAVDLKGRFRRAEAPR